MKTGTTTQRLGFNMVEVAVALIIVMVALVDIMGMIPQGIKSSTDARGRASAADVADQFLQYMSAQIEADWDQTGAFPEVKSTKTTTDLIFSSKTMVSESNLRIEFEAPNELTDWDPDTCNTGLFRVSQLTGASMIDFRSEVRVWKEVVEYKKDFTTPSTQVVRVSTPAANIPEAETTVTAGALWAGGLIRAIGQNVELAGGHSNGDLVIGQKVTVSSAFSYVGSADMKGGQDSTKVDSQTAPTLPRTFAEYKALAQAAGTYFTSNVEVQNGSGGTIRLKAQKVNIPNNSVIVVEGGTIVAKEKGFNRSATLVSDMEISMNCNDLTITPAMDDVVSYSKGGDIHINGNNMNITGTVKTTGSIHFNGNSGTVLTGALWADGDVQVNGNDMSVKGDGSGGTNCNTAFIADFASDHRSVRVNASCLIEEVTLTFCGGATQTFTGLSSKSVPLWGTGEHDLKRIEVVKITTDCKASETVTNTNVDCSAADDKGSPGEEMTGRTLICVLNAEVSWPLDAPYEKRTKVVYRSEIAKPAEVVKR